MGEGGPHARLHEQPRQDGQASAAGPAARRPKLDAFTGVIDQILREDQARPKKQRHTATRIGERLRAEYGFTGGDTIVKAYVRAQRLGGQDVRAPDPSAGRRPGRLWRSAGGDRRGRTEGTLPGRRPPAQRRRVCAGVSGRDDGGVLRRAQRRVRLLRRRAAAHRLRQHEAGGGADPRGRHAPADGRSSASSSRTTYSTLASDARARATTKARWKGWSGTPAATSSCRSPGAPVGTR